jgi:hypothetical protein
MAGSRLYAANKSQTTMAAVQNFTPRMDPAMISLCVQALQNLRTGLAQALLYSEATDQYAKAVEATYSTLSPLAEALGVLELSIHRGVVLLNGQELQVPVSALPAVAAIERAFCKAGLYRYRFSAGMTAAELSSFMQLLAWSKFETTGPATANALLSDNGVRNITVPEGKSTSPLPKPIISFEAPTIPAPAAKAPASGLTPAVPRQLPAHDSTVIMPSLSGAVEFKATLQGRIEEIGFLNVLRLAGGKDGILSLHTAEGEARVAVKGRTIISASYRGKSGLEALLEISEVHSGPFAYLAAEHDIARHIDIKIADLELELRRLAESQPKRDVDFF